MSINYKKKFLHVGCGVKDISNTPFKLSSWEEIRFDIDPQVNPDVVGSMTEMNNIENNSLDAIFSSHNIEHLYPHEVTVALKEFQKKLKPQGFILITCPDLKSVCSLVVQDKLLEPAYESGKGPISPLDIIYGHRSSIAKGNTFMAHKCGFTEKVLIKVLQKSGFCQVISQTRSSEFDIWALATCKEWQEKDIKSLAIDLFP
ncbi:methyltransferase domain-containing protein [Prochlorococcus sp. MIT 0801]|uniref:class I SAM-dependent methyltransferase n=1 Tax=Prochlorococcus sp. MIT 0801 TaxID=1501269 RepID=UPI0004F7238B|nr:methyltransferase domain-containing protein [Prochlorococcus sp. MIT 0801]AIQ98264.1 Methyltransferase type 11 [Prochlorococcus sp. MIT 0801]